jgi:hypothetical protein
MTYIERHYPRFSACGLNCGLCPRYHTEGKSRCPGCAGKGFSEKHPSCGVLSCSQRKRVEYCYQCDEYPCQKYDGADLFDSFITHKNQFHDLDKAKRIGIEAYESEMNEKWEVLTHLLKNYDDGRRKSLYCAAVNLLDLQDVNLVLEKMENEKLVANSIKEEALTATRLLEEMAERRHISLQMRKKS